MSVSFSVYPVQAQSQRNIYTCISDRGKPTTIVDTKRGRIRLIVWESNYFGSSGWTPQKRCEEITKRFQKYSDDGTLRQITTGKIIASNGGIYNIVCVANNQPGTQGQCLKDGLLLTLESGDNPKQVLNSLFQSARDVGLPAFKRGTESFNLLQYLEQAPLMEAVQENNTSSSENTTIIKDTIEQTEKNTENNTCPAILCN
ncbi:hypothetical protein GM3709_3012 [Geminocystis sp. NIES-3709]|nr:hypothetical protein GM3709_3012 [Geminocystis sp. NIES-3709]